MRVIVRVRFIVNLIVSAMVSMMVITRVRDSVCNQFRVKLRMRNQLALV